ncbi:MAG: tetratricopeptide repeat protein [Acidobacteriota bacterium]
MSRALRGVGLALAVVVAIAAVAIVARRWRPASSSPASGPRADGVAAAFVGSDACVTCHATQSQAWRTSQHAHAMAVASDATVLGQFTDSTFTYAGTTSSFYKRNKQFYVRTDGADGMPAEFEVTHTFGVYPLQQYLVPMPGGRLQALSIAWDARPKAAGGQRWFHLYPTERIGAKDPLHWTGLRQNSNFMCADCHTTNLKKGYDADARRFGTTWTELGVGCEACHGPGSAHVSLMGASGASGAPAGLGLTARLDERKNVAWTTDVSTGAPVRSLPRTSEREIDVCARCHARRSQLTDAAIAGQPFADNFRATLLEPAIFRPDGQPLDEVYNYAAFAQSKMHAKGVTCSDCHDPHSGTLRAAGNSTCTRCHQSARFDVSAHTMHAAGTPAAACATCHMPVSTYMVIDPRHDHSFRIPRPDRTASLGVPNVCTSACHAGKSPAWASAAIRTRNGRQAAGYQTFAEAFAAVERDATGATRELERIAGDETMPALVRASALERMQSQSDVDVPGVVRLLADSDALVRRAAVTLLARADDRTRLTSVVGMLTDSRRTVRTEAVLALMDVADRGLAGPDRQAFDRAFDEFVAEQRYNADRPEAQTNLGQALLQRGQLDEAQSTLTEAIRLDRTFVPAYVNLSDVYRVRHDETAAERVLREALAVDPRAAVVHHALGLALVRQHRVADALPSLARAMALEPANPRYVYVYAVALHDDGRVAVALNVLRAAAAKWPSDRAIAEAIAAYQAR